ncbi:MAG: polysaccharide pyruvyl transferase family protein [Rhodospirillales bacterium]|jgi:hypothetical protein|nr:polysaccharide pyruvyl transferase family protein [Rhodospirillales bacterium]
MKIGVLTFHDSYNFGANLQTLATQSVLEQHGATAVVINYVDRRKRAHYDTITSPAQAACHHRFVQRYLHVSPEFDSTADIEAYCLDHLDGVVVGSDAVFRLATAYHPRNLFRRLVYRHDSSSHFNNAAVFPPYWLDWRARTKDSAFGKFAIAASSTGTEFIFVSVPFLKRAWRALGDFDGVTVRDGWTRLMVRCLSFGRVRPEICPDPVFALPKVFAIPADERPAADLTRTVLLSGKFPAAWRGAVIDRLHARGYRVANLPNPDQDFAFPEADTTIGLPISPVAWYATLAGAGGFVGRRFHAMVSCVANGVPIVSCERRPKADPLFHAKHKSYDLCRRAGMPGRFMSEQALMETPAAAVVDLLFEPASQAAARHYADRAAQRFSEIIAAHLHVLAEKRRARPPQRALSASAIP